MALSRDFNLPAARSTLFTGSCLHQRSLHSAGKLSGKGFSLIEVLMVVLVMGILCGTGISIYAGVTHDSQTRARTDELKSFFQACRLRASMRRTPLRIFFRNQTFMVEQSSSLQLRIPELDGDSVFETIDVGADGVFSHAGQRVKALNLNLRMPGNKLETVNLEL